MIEMPTEKWFTAGRKHLARIPVLVLTRRMCCWFVSCVNSCHNDEILWRPLGSAYLERFPYDWRSRNAVGSNAASLKQALARLCPQSPYPFIRPLTSRRASSIDGSSTKQCSTDLRYSATPEVFTWLRNLYIVRLTSKTTSSMASKGPPALN